MKKSMIGLIVLSFLLNGCRVSEGDQVPRNLVGYQIATAAYDQIFKVTRVNEIALAMESWINATDEEEKLAIAERYFPKLKLIEGADSNKIHVVDLASVITFKSPLDAYYWEIQVDKFKSNRDKNDIFWVKRTADGQYEIIWVLRDLNKDYTTTTEVDTIAVYQLKDAQVGRSFYVTGGSDKVEPGNLRNYYTRASYRIETPFWIHCSENELSIFSYNQNPLEDGSFLLTAFGPNSNEPKDEVTATITNNQVLIGFKGKEEAFKLWNHLDPWFLILQDY